MMRSILLLSLLLGVALGFAPSPVQKTTASALNLFDEKKRAAAVVAAALFTAGGFATAAQAASFTDASSQVIAARSGGRAGGRSSGGRSSYRGGGGGYGGGGSYGGASRSYAAPRTTYRSSTTIVRPMIAPPVMVSPFGYGGYGGSPIGGFGLGYGLGAMNNNQNAMRDYRQESEIQQSKAELEVAKNREAELESRIKALEEQGKLPAAPAATAPVPAAVQ